MNTADKRVATVAVAVYVVILVVSFFVFKFTVTNSFEEFPPKEGILVALGDAREGLGSELLQKTPAPETETTTAAVQPQQQNVPAPKQNVPNPSADKSDVKENDNDPEAVLKTTAAKNNNKPKVNQSALYKANNGSTATSIGQKSGTGTMGSPNGSQDSDNHTITDGFSLDGRSIVGVLPRPGYASNSEGRVVVKITVDREGYVTQADFDIQKSTTSDSRLVAEAIAAAKKARFNRDEKAAFVATGTITYIFKVQ